MAVSALVAMTVMQAGMKSINAVSSYYANKEADRAALNEIKTQIALNNEIGMLNQKLINEDEIREMRAFGLDMAELARQTTNAISGTVASNPYAIGTRTGDALVRNVGSQAARAKYIKELNFGTKIRSLNIERLNRSLTLQARNVALTKGFVPKANLVKTGLQIAGAGTEAATEIAGAPKAGTGRVSPKTSSFKTTTRATTGPRQGFL